MPAKESDFDNLPPTNSPGQPPLDDSWVEKRRLEFGNYTHIAELGKGGFSLVYHVRHRSLGFVCCRRIASASRSRVVTATAVSGVSSWCPAPRS